MTDAISVLNMNDLGRWEIIREGRIPYELSSGSVVLLEVDGVLRLTSVEYGHDGRGYYSVNGYLLAGGLRAAPPAMPKTVKSLPRELRSWRQLSRAIGGENELWASPYYSLWCSYGSSLPWCHVLARTARESGETGVGTAQA